MSFDFQPVLESQLVALRPLRSSDFGDLYAVACDPLVWEQHPARDRHAEAVFREFFREALASGGALVARDGESNRVIGSSRFHGYDEQRSEIKIGWSFLARSHWGGVYNGEMKRLMLRHAFQFVEHVVLLIGRDNLRSRRAAQKVGGVDVGMRPHGSGPDVIVYQISAPSCAT